MQEQTGATYQSSTFGKEMIVAEAKSGKTAASLAWALGAFPWQKDGGIVASPAELHVITFDSNALGHASKFLTQTCGARPEALKFNVYNMQGDYSKIHMSQSDYDGSFYNTIILTLQKIAQRAAGQKAPVVLFSSLTGAASGVLRGVSGPVREHSKSVMDQNKWGLYAIQLNELRNTAQQDNWHTIWEAHLVMKSGGKDDAGNAAEKESLAIMGREGVNWPYNVEHVYRFRRKFGQRYGTSKLEQVVLEPKPNLEFIAGGRGFTEFLDTQEPDMAHVFRKLGLKTGGYRAIASGAVQVPVTAPVKKLVQRPVVKQAVKPAAYTEE